MIEQPVGLSPIRGRQLAALGAALREDTRPLRVTTHDGQMHAGSHIGVFYDVLVLSRNWREQREIPLADVVRIERRQLRLARAFAVGAAVTGLGALAGALYFAPRWQTDNAGPGAWAFLGAVFGAMLGAVEVWMLQDLPSFHRWHTVFA